MYPIDCPICIPSPGFLLIKKGNYETKYHCTCRRGQLHKYQGSECEKKTSIYYCASIDSLPAGTIDALIADNQKRYGIKKVGDRWMKPDEPQITKEQVKEMRMLARSYMRMDLQDPFTR